MNLTSVMQETLGRPNLFKLYRFISQFKTLNSSEGQVSYWRRLYFTNTDAKDMFSKKRRCLLSL